MDKKAYRAIELFSYKEGNFICPCCSKSFYFKINKKIDSIILGQCSECKNNLKIVLPKLTKKLVYLDQWFVSNLFNEKTGVQFEKLINKLENLVSLQKIVVIVSPVHVGETANITFTEKQRLIWGKFNSLSKGEISKNKQDIYVSQSKRMILGEEEMFLWSDILVNNPHEWSISKYFINGISVHLFSNLEKVKLQKILSPSTESLNEEMKKIIHNQASGIDLNSSENECLQYVKKLWLHDLRDAISYYKKVNKIIGDNKNERDGLLPNQGSGFYPVIKSIIDTCRLSSEKISVDNILTRLRRSNNIPKCMNLSLALQALRLHSALQSLKRNGSLTKNKKKFSREYGVSSSNDASHISTYVPYVDVFITDNSARKLLQKEIVKKHLSNQTCKIFSNNNMDIFEKHLDELLESKQENNIELTLKIIGSQRKHQRMRMYKKEILKVLSEKLKKQI